MNLGRADFEKAMGRRVTVEAVRAKDGSLYGSCGLRCSTRASRPTVARSLTRRICPDDLRSHFTMTLTSSRMSCVWRV
jgi:hypothetical protein